MSGSMQPPPVPPRVLGHELLVNRLVHKGGFCTRCSQASERGDMLDDCDIERTRSAGSQLITCSRSRHHNYSQCIKGHKESVFTSQKDHVHMHDIICQCHKSGHNNIYQLHSCLHFQMVQLSRFFQLNRLK